MSGAELLVRCLANEGLKHMFGVPGEENLAVIGGVPLDVGPPAGGAARPPGRGRLRLRERTREV